MASFVASRRTAFDGGAIVAATVPSFLRDGTDAAAVSADAVTMVPAFMFSC